MLCGLPLPPREGLLIVGNLEPGASAMKKRQERLEKLNYSLLYRQDGAYANGWGVRREGVGNNMYAAQIAGACDALFSTTTTGAAGCVRFLIMSAPSLLARARP